MSQMMSDLLEFSRQDIGRAIILDYADRIETDLRKNLLPFWRRHAPDHERQLFIGALTDDLGPVPNAIRGALLTSRILWTFSAAYRQYGAPEDLRMAEFAYRALTSQFLDTKYGGLIWSIRPDLTPESSRKQIYGQAFGLYALVEYHLASGLSDPLNHAIGLFRLIEARGRDRICGGYQEAFDRDWSDIADVRLSEVDLNSPKSQNTHLHVLEAYISLLKAWPKNEVRQALRVLLEIMCSKIVDPSRTRLGLFFSDDWIPQSNERSYGHDIEASWLLWEAAIALDEEAVCAYTRPIILEIAAATLRDGVDSDGGVYNRGAPSGVIDYRKEWWPQSEAMVGFLNAYQLTQDSRYLAGALKAWGFIERYLIDREHGEWRRGVTRNGAPLNQEHKISFWKCPYHNGRAALKAVTWLRKIASNL